LPVISITVESRPKHASFCPLIVNLQRLAKQISHLLRTLRLIWAATHNRTLLWAALLVLQGVLPAAVVYLTRPVVDTLVLAVDSGASWNSIRPLLVLGGVIIGVLLLIELVQSASSWIRTEQAELIRDHLSALIHNKSTTADVAFYESPECHDRLEQARNELSNRPLALLENGGVLLQNLVTLGAIGGLLVPYGIWLPFVLGLSTVPALTVLLRYNSRHHSWWTRTTADRRLTQYYDGMLTTGAVALELRMFDLAPYFQAAYQRLRVKLRLERVKLAKDQAIGRFLAGMFGITILGLAMSWMLSRVLHQRATLGDLALFYQAFNQGQSLLRSLLENAGQIYTNTLFLGNLFDFLDLRPNVLDPSTPILASDSLSQAIRFEDVTFAYPGTHASVLQEFNLSIPAGQIAALVGVNGAGKSTLLKLLCRFYDPQKGRITFDNIDIRHLSISKLRRMVTVLFQLPVTYQATAAENIAYGDLSAGPKMSEIETAARFAGAHEFITGLSKGYNSRLGRWFLDGTELSVGEWQRIALARAFLRRAQIIILDEPTSALDSWSEMDWFDRFRSLAQGKTALVITHRLTVARHADIIHVMDAGTIVESGTHDQLLAEGKIYAASWFAQVQESSSIAGVSQIGRTCNVGAFKQQR
jgi:ATP-binding cassette, subfamily B, bacterial